MSSEKLTKEDRKKLSAVFSELGRKLGKIGGPARAAALSPERRKEIGRIANAASVAARRAAKEAKDGK